MRLLDRRLRRLASPMAISIADSIDSTPPSWAMRDGNHLIRDDGNLEIWIANAAYGLNLRYGGGLRSGNFTPSAIDRWLIWRAVKRLNLPSARECKYQDVSAVVASYSKD